MRTDRCAVILGNFFAAAAIAFVVVYSFRVSVAPHRRHRCAGEVHAIGGPTLDYVVDHIHQMLRRCGSKQPCILRPTLGSVKYPAISKRKFSINSSFVTFYVRRGDLHESDKRPLDQFYLLLPLVATAAQSTLQQTQLYSI